MKLTKSVIDKLTITDVKGMDAIAVMAENFGPGQGKITITCFNDCWSYYWGAMGEKATMRTFFMDCDNSYLISKLSSGTISTVRNDDQEEWTKTLRLKIIERRRVGDFTGKQARDLWDQADAPSNGYSEPDPDLFFEVFGDEWWNAAPQMANPNYDHLSRVVDTVKLAFKENTV